MLQWLDGAYDAQTFSAADVMPRSATATATGRDLRAVELFPSVFMPLCAPALLDAARVALADPGGAPDVPLLGRPDWWALWHRARGSAQVLPPGSFGTTFSAEYLDIAAADWWTPMSLLLRRLRNRHEPSR